MELTFEEMKIVRQQCRNKGVATFTINPKSLTIDQLMGTFDENSHDWNDGIMAHAMRISSQDNSERRNWIVFDGPIDPVWVENLNSVLDDNKKLTLSTGESIKVRQPSSYLTSVDDRTDDCYSGG
jgi:dynein heavy chain